MAKTLFLVWICSIWQMWDPVCVILLRHGMTFSFTQKAHKSSENWFCDKTALVFIVGGPWFKARKALPIFQTNLRIYCQGWYETCRGVNRKYLLLLKGGERWQNFLPDHFVFKKDSTSPYKGTTSLHTLGKRPGNSHRGENSHSGERHTARVFWGLKKLWKLRIG